MINILSLVAGICYILIGIGIMIYKFFAIPLDKNTAYPLGILMIAYGIFRIIRVINKLKKLKKEDNE